MGLYTKIQNADNYAKLSTFNRFDELFRYKYDCTLSKISSRLLIFSEPSERTLIIIRRHGLQKNTTRRPTKTTI